MSQSKWNNSGGLDTKLRAGAGLKSTNFDYLYGTQDKNMQEGVF